MKEREVMEILGQAREALARGNRDEAVAQAQEILKGSPRHLEARLFLGARLLEGGDWPGAREQFEMVLRAEPVHLPALLGLGEALFFIGDKEASRLAIERAIELYPGDEGTRTLLRILHGSEVANISLPQEGSLASATSNISPHLATPASGFAKERYGENEILEGDEDYEDEPWMEFIAAERETVPMAGWPTDPSPPTSMSRGEAWVLPSSSEQQETAEPIPPAEGAPLVVQASSDLGIEDDPKENSRRQAVEVILSSKTRLQEKYGAEGFRRINDKAQNLAEAISANAGMEALVIYLDDPETLAPYGLAPADAREGLAVQSFLGSLHRGLAGRGQKLSFILLLGGDEIIPLFRLPNPSDDPDREVLSDAPYGGGENYFLPQRAVGRIPDGDSPDPNLFLTLIEGTIAAHSQNRRRPMKWLRRIFGRRNSKSLGLTAQIWKEASARVFSAIGSPKRMEVSPPASDFEFLERHQELPAMAYFNLHGLEDSPYWYGHEVKGQEEEFPIAITPQNLVWAGAPSSVVFSEACYGAKFVGHKVADSLALSFLAAGARTVIGSTAMSYGALRPPLSGADLLGLNLWRGLSKGYPVGEALRRAKLGLVEEMGMRQGFLDGEDQKTVLSFILLGDPSLPGPAFNAPQKLKGEDGKQVFCPSVVCGHQSQKMEKVSVADEVLDKVQKDLRKNMLFVGQAGFQVRRQVLCHGECGCAGHRSSSKNEEAPHMLAHSLVFTTQREIPLWGDKPLKQVVRVTTDPAGKVLKLAISK